MLFYNKNTVPCEHSLLVGREEVSGDGGGGVVVGWGWDRAGGIMLQYEKAPKHAILNDQ